MILYSYLEKLKHKSKYLLTAQDYKRPMNPVTVYRALIRLQERLGIEQSISPHKFRHYFAKKFIKKGGDLSSLQTILGHTELSTTEMYLRFNIDELKENYDEIMKD